MERPGDKKSSGNTKHNLDTRKESQRRWRGMQCLQHSLATVPSDAPSQIRLPFGPNGVGRGSSQRRRKHVEREQVRQVEVGDQLRVDDDRAAVADRGAEVEQDVEREDRGDEAQVPAPLLLSLGIIFIENLSNFMTFIEKL